jgi:S1-C subfamily serine protease
MNTAIFSESGSSAGVGFAVPANEIARIVNQIIQNGRVKLAGIGIQPVPPSIAMHLGIQNGILVADVLPNTPASKAGILPTHRNSLGRIVLGDVILALNGHPVKNYDELYHLLNQVNIGDKVRLKILRQGSFIEVAVQTIDIGAY